MARYLLDSDAVIDYLKHIERSRTFIRQLASGTDVLATCDVVLVEFFSGLYPEDEGEALEFLTTLEYLETSREAAEQAGRWRFSYARQGRQFSPYDALIAAIALDHSATIVTGNVRDFPMPEIRLLALPR